MAKRYKQSMRGDYEGPDSRRRQEMMDASMIREDHGAIANLPQNVVYREYPKRGYYIPEEYGDTMGSIDRQRGRDYDKIKEHFDPEIIP